ncbi:MULTISPECIES: hypothetical protein [unclassified Pseudomonas]|uniref:hypothetical protein n=1 Tax=unclassified Pseudomonas TaxID=196821 RepID=UPI00244A3B5C|nr:MULTISPECIES: hypothetical protein [unclassified Pseudomonas]MDH0302396.1 hypothetical protein [Pseudomonas sp. GD04091]MDH1984838.1 hypothetical protein [Pseudomonas sp. GD03689]
MQPSTTACPAGAQRPESHRTAAVLSVVSLLAFMLTVGSTAGHYLGGTNPTLLISLLCLSLLMNLYVFSSLLEMTLTKGLLELKSSIALGVVILAVLLKFSQIDAQADVNAIFHVDPSRLPMTMGAATLFHLLIKVHWPIYGAFVLSLWLLVFSNEARLKKKAKLSYPLCHFVNSLGLLLIAMAISSLLVDSERRHQILYRYAHMADFISYTPCSNIHPDEFDALYIDHAPARLLIAPKITDSELIEPEKHWLLKFVRVPSSFRTVTCDYASATTTAAEHQVPRGLARAVASATSGSSGQ